MKIRHGFVSNSSSSSFCILGVSINSEEYDKIEEMRLIKKTELDYTLGISDYDGYFAGFYPDKMKEDETLLEFKNRLKAELDKVGINSDIKDMHWYIDGGNDN